MGYVCATWDTQNDGFRKGPRFTPTLDGIYRAPGFLQKEELNAGLLHSRRVLFLTHLAVHGPARSLDLLHMHGPAGRSCSVLRGMCAAGLLESRPVRPLRAKDCGRCARVWSVTETGRWALWRLAWLTRSAFVPAPLKWELDTGIPSDPVEAVRAHVQNLFLRPASYIALRDLMRSGEATRRQIAAGIGAPYKDMWARFQGWERKGWVEPTRNKVPSVKSEYTFTRRLTVEGHNAVLRHVAALRQAGLACGWTPYPGAVQYGPGLSRYHYEEEFLEMGWEL